MKKKAELEDGHQELEILKAVAQAWHSHSGNSRPTTEFDAYRRNFKGKPSRFKIEAMKRKTGMEFVDITKWDFRQSLWDSCEIVTVSKSLEAGLVEEDENLLNQSDRYRSGRERKTTLRYLFDHFSSRRFNEPTRPP